ncbi:hypothetical protein P153DRAFT_431242 [Dothidotthia symphoricarpi CBS 119687]|uniref:Uncharacterized protein n=1 Tax=Dothidotthia symphoricarpi CBS 119687 TaxID=1392245 RepID=A0A6A6ABS5_9PLEO|nr:uncharacterized protein P153DRAFT_431242 [Dothidotthia symphoricarpi CBS 119687]KAF2129249.1 hypothetical protein P153DRAFT_431242 [Dothidotthia symphoricarpi CBS 119687]
MATPPSSETPPPSLKTEKAPTLGVYTLEQITTFAQERFPIEFDLISNAQTYKFQRKVFLDDDSQCQEREMLQVGGSTSGGASQTWAHATGFHVSFYSGKPDKVLLRVPDARRSHIRFESPFVFVADRVTGSKTKAQTTQKGVMINVFINFVFLATERTRHILSPPEQDLLPLFEKGCRNFQPNKDATELEAREHAERERTKTERIDRIVHDNTMRSTPRKRNITDPVDTQAMSEPPPRKKRFSDYIQGHVESYESEMEYEHKQEKEALLRNVQELQVKLEEQERRTAAAEQEAHVAKSKVKSWRKKLADKEVDIEEIRNDNGALHRRCQQQKAEVEALRKQVKEHAKCQLEFAEQTQKEKETQLKCQQHLTGQISKQHTDYEAAKAEIDKQKRDIEMYKECNASLESKLSDAELQQRAAEQARDKSLASHTQEAILKDEAIKEMDACKTKYDQLKEALDAITRL